MAGRRFVTLSLLPLLALVLSSGPAAAQTTAAVEVTPPAQLPRIGVGPDSTTIPIAWTVHLDNPVMASEALADGQARLDWTLTCPDRIALEGPASTPVPYQAGRGGSTGVADLTFSAAPEAIGMNNTSCTLEARFRDGKGLREGSAAVPLLLVVDYVGGLEAAASEPAKMAGPQKLIHFPVELWNRGNSRTRVAFELAEMPGGRWNAVVPEPAVLEPGASAVASFAVATPFSTGYNSGAADFRLRVLPAAAVDPTVAEEPQEVTFRATSKGWYVPGPSPLLALAALGLAGVLLRRRAQRP